MIINITGMGHSGKSLLTDIIQENLNYEISPAVEFELFRMPYGLLDLLDVVDGGNDPLRFKIVHTRLVRQLRRMSNSVIPALPWTYLLNSGHGYSKIYGKEFLEFIKEIESLKSCDLKDITRIDVLSHLSESSLNFALSKLKLMGHQIQLESMPNFDITDLADELIASIHRMYKADTKDVVLLNNALDHFSLLRKTASYLNIKTVFVKRDPRDIWISLFGKQKTYSPKWERSSWSDAIKTKLWPEDIDDFIQQYSLTMERLNSFPANVLVVNYEDLVLETSEELERICNFLSIPKLDSKKAITIASRSTGNVMLNSKENSSDLNRIKLDLSKYLYE